MIVTQNWLKEWVDIQESPAELAHLLTMGGLEVDAITNPFPSMQGVVVGHVQSKIQHPSADKLSVCKVDVGESTPLTIVCGASNVAAGQKVPVVMIGGELPGGLHIKLTELRGVQSEGMICSEKELGLQERSAGIMQLPVDAPVGQSFSEYCRAPDIAFEIGITPNRGDCFSIWGIVREIAARSGRGHRPFTTADVPATTDAQMKVEVQSKYACTEYCSRVITNISTQVKTPLWMAECLRRCGLKSISPIVDVTNYVMWLTGQPMHAFDQTAILGNMVVRDAQEGETLTLLDGQTVTLNTGNLLIADCQGPLALAGIMGGQRSMVKENTSHVVLESAHFLSSALAGIARSLGLHTDGSHRWERGVDPRLPKIAIEMATHLILEIAGGQAGPTVQYLAEENFSKKIIVLDRSLIQKTLGLDLDALRVKTFLKALEFECEIKSQDQFLVKPPSHRFDITLPIDLVEEVARMVGYEHIQETPLLAPLKTRSTPEKSLSITRLKSILVDAGYHEAMNYSFIAESDHALFFAEQKGCRLLNPLSTDLSTMRLSLIPGLVKALSYNQNRQAVRVRLFEVGRSFEPSAAKLAKESEKLAGIVYGPLFPLNWEINQDATFYHVKSDIDRMIKTLGVESCLYQKEEIPSYLHPGQSATIWLKGQKVGVIGTLHPSIQKAYKLKGKPVVFELNLDSLKLMGFLPILHELPKFPSIKRDLALVVEKNCCFEDVRKIVTEEMGALLHSLDLFDIYEGEGLPSGKKSFALSLILQDLSRTLKDDELNTAIQSLLARLNREVGAMLRE